MWIAVLYSYLMCSGGQYRGNLYRAAAHCHAAFSEGDVLCASKFR